MAADQAGQLAPLRAAAQQLDEAFNGLLAELGDDARRCYATELAHCRASCEQTRRILSSDNANPHLLHDLRNAVGAVLGYAELISEEAEDAGDPATISVMRRLRREADGLLEQLQRRRSGYARAATAPVEDIELPGEEEPGTLLVIDDEEASRELLLRHLERRGHRVFGAESGQKALQILGDEAVDLIFLDMVMPEMNGLELLKRIKSNEGLRAIPVIVVSGNEDTEGVIHCIEGGAEDYLYKPFNPVLLHARLRAGLQRKRWHDRELEYQRELERNQRFIRNTFGRYLSDEIVDALLETPEGLNLGGITTDVTILMADIRNFTTISERLGPERVVNLLNNYLGVMSEIIMGHDGTVDEFIGDAILAIFGAPVQREDDAARAIACAVAMQRAVAGINQRNADLDLPSIAIGIGLNSGTVVAGNIGSEKRSKYAVVGHPVNLTARIESYTRGGEVLASAATIAAAGVEVSTGRVFSVQPKGMAELLKVHEITGIGEPWRLTVPAADAGEGVPPP